MTIGAIVLCIISKYLSCFIQSISCLKSSNREVRQFIVSLLYKGFVKIGGMDGLVEMYGKAIPEVRHPNSTCGYPRDDAFNIFRDPISSDNPWPGLLLQASLGCFWYWCADQVCT